MGLKYLEFFNELLRLGMKNQSFWGAGAGG